MPHFFPADILLPKKNFDKWAVVACDQFTSQESYWTETKKIVGSAPSSLNIILPEIYLSSDNSENIKKVNDKMKEYLSNDIFDIFENSMIYIERETSCGIRKGVIGMIDLEEYDYKNGSHALIRATEQTVIERIPPRVQIRKDAPLELPHILLLVDDEQKTVIEPLAEKKESFSSAYNFDLMQGGGHINGYFIDNETQNQITSALDNLIEGQKDKLMFAVGDGNHSLATAKECYNLTKNPLSKYALVEIVNIHDPSIVFEPIYRVLFNINEEDFLKKFINYTSAFGTDKKQKFSYISTKVKGSLEVEALSALPVGTLQSFIDEYIKENPTVCVDYIHGEDVVKTLCEKDNTLGFIFDSMQKNELFSAIKADGSLPRKTFSMGHAQDKRYYIEARKIK